MALLFIDGFDHYDDAEITDKWAFRTNTYINSGGRFGSSYMKHLSTHSSYDYFTLPARNEVILGVAVKVEALNYTYLAGSPFIALRDPAGVDHIKLHLNSDSKIYVLRGDDTVLGSPDSPIMPDQWYYLEVRVKVDDSAGELELRVNEQVLLNLSGIDTRNGGEPSIGHFRFRGIYYNTSAYYDDLYVDDAQFHGNVQVKTFMPDSDGTYSDWTRSAGANDYECIDEVPTNNDTDYIKSSTKGHKSSFGITTGALETVKGIQLNHHVRAAAAGIRRIKPFIRSGGADYNAPVSGVLGAEFNYILNIFQTDPQDGQPWNQTKLEAAEFGLRLVDGTTTTSTTSTTTTT